MRESPISNESRLCSLEAANHAPWAVIREKVFNTGQAATGGLHRLADCNMAIRKLSPPPLHPSRYGVESLLLILSKRRKNTMQKRKEGAGWWGAARGEESCLFFSPNLPEMGRVYCCSGCLPLQCLQVQPKEPQTKLGQPEVLLYASAFLSEHSCTCSKTQHVIW